MEGKEPENLSMPDNTEEVEMTERPSAENTEDVLAPPAEGEQGEINLEALGDRIDEEVTGRV